MGYSPGKTLFGAPYDFRLPVDALMQSKTLGTNNTFEEDLRLLIERAYNSSGNKRVHIVTHSLGGPTILYFLNRRPLSWKDKFVSSFIPIAGPFAGSLKALKTMVSGDNLGMEVPILDWSLLSVATIARNFRQVRESVVFAWVFLTALRSRLAAQHTFREQFSFLCLYTFVVLILFFKS